MSVPPRVRPPSEPGLRLVTAPPASSSAVEPGLDSDWPGASGPQLRSDRIGRLESASAAPGATASLAPFYIVSPRFEAWGVVAGVDCDLALGEEWVPTRVTHTRDRSGHSTWSLDFDFAALTAVSLATRERALALVGRVGAVGFNPAGPGVRLRLPLERLLGSAFRVNGWDRPAARPSVAGWWGATG